jgi:hypothetical protein
MTEPHTADLATRYRYRQEGRELEQERIANLIEVEKWNTDSIEAILALENVSKLIKEQE